MADTGVGDRRHRNQIAPNFSVTVTVVTVSFGFLTVKLLKNYASIFSEEKAKYKCNHFVMWEKFFNFVVTNLKHRHG